MVVGAGYVFIAPAERREILIERGEEEGERVADPVYNFDHSKKAPLVVFGVFADKLITHIIEGRKGASAGTGLVRLNLSNWLRLPSPITFDVIGRRIEARYKSYLMRALETGGLLPPGTMLALVETIIEIAPETRLRLARFSSTRRARIRAIPRRSSTNLALQKEALSTSLLIADFPQEAVLAWDWPSDASPASSFLDGLPEARVREDTMLEVDHSSIPGFRLDRTTHIASRVFTKEDGSRLTVVMANRTNLEEQTGADLIYFHEVFKCFILVQYKAMEVERSKYVFRWRQNKADQLMKEISRMEKMLKILKGFKADLRKESFRLHQNPFFLKICPRIVFNPDDKGLFKGMYIPLEYWQRFQLDECSKGPQGGRYISYENIGRKLTNFQFINLVADAWIGTTVTQSAFLQDLIRNIVSTGRTVTLAMHEPANLHKLPVETIFEEWFTIEEEEEQLPPIRN